MPEKAPEHLAQMPSSTRRGFSGSNSSLASNFNKMDYSNFSHKKTKSASLAPSPKPSENNNFHAAVRRTWKATRSKRPWTKWQISLGKTEGLTLAMTYPATSTTSSDCNTADTPTPTPQQSNKRPSTHPSTDTTTTHPPPSARKCLAFYPSPPFSGPADPANK